MSNDTVRDALAERLTKLADYFSPPSGAGTDHAISCECHKCEWADDLREAARTLAAAPAQPMTCDGCGKPVRPLLCGHCAPASEPQAEPQPEAIPIAPVEVVRQALKELLESISECRMDQVTARFAKASVMARAVVDRYKDAT